MTRLPLATLASLGLVLVLAPAVHAQTGSVAGTVVDESGGVVPGASAPSGDGSRNSTSRELTRLCSRNWVYWSMLS